MINSISLHSSKGERYELNVSVNTIGNEITINLYDASGCSPESSVLFFRWDMPLEYASELCSKLVQILNSNYDYKVYYVGDEV